MKQSRTPLPDSFIAIGADQKISPDVWEDLRVLLAFSRAGTIAKCAEFLGVTQPTIIRKLANLEEQLDRKLLVRSTRGSSLTQEGERLVALADQIDRQVSLAIAAQHVAPREIEGTVRISSTDGLLSYWLAPTLQTFQAQYPGISIELYSTNEPPQLERREVDIVLSFFDFQGSDVQSRRVGYVHLVPCVSKSFVRRYGMPGDQPDWSEYPIVDHIGYRDMMAGFGDWIQLTSSATNRYVSNNSTTYYHMVRSGVGIGYLGNYAAMDPEIIVVPGHRAHTVTPLYVAALRVLQDDPSVNAAQEWVQSTFEKFGDPWFRKSLMDMDNLDVEAHTPDSDMLQAFLSGHAVLNRASN